VDHPNIVKLYDQVEDEKYYHLVLEHCAGGELFSRLMRHHKFQEKHVAHIVYQVISAVCHLHQNGIVHRDLKPENIMFSSEEEDNWDVKLIDLGFSIRSESRTLSTIVGSPHYVAPEVFSGNYGPQCDIWSVGVLTYVLLCGQAPFQGHSHAEII